MTQSQLGGNVPAHLVDVRALPGNATTGRAGGELLLRLMDEWRHSFGHCFLGNALEQCVALETTRERLECLEFEGRNDLADLFPVLAAVDQETPRAHPTIAQADIAREDDPMLTLGDSDYL